MTGHLEQLEAAERQLLVFAREINHLYPAELERTLDRLRGSYLDMIKTLAFVVEAKDPSTRAHLQRTHDYAVALAEAVDPEWPPTSSCATGSCSTTWARSASPKPCSTSPGRWTPTSGRSCGPTRCSGS